MAGRRDLDGALGFASHGDPITGERSPEVVAAFVDATEVALRDSKAHKSLTAQQELYCQYRAEGMTKKAAFTKAGLLGDKQPAYATRYASDLEERVYIRARIGVIAAARALKVKKEPTTPTQLTAEGLPHVTKEWLQKRLLDLSNEAEAAGEFGQAIKATELLGKSIGLFSDKPTGKEKTRPNEGEIGSNVEPEGKIDLQIINQFFDQADDSAGTGDQARDITPAPRAAPKSIAPDTGDRPLPTLVELDRLAGTLAEGVFDEAEG